MECNFNVASITMQRFLINVMEQHEVKYEQWLKQGRLELYGSKRSCLGHCSYLNSCCSITFERKRCIIREATLKLHSIIKISLWFISK